jgi:hypothetical protein
VRAPYTPADQLERQHVEAGDQQQRELDAEERVGGDDAAPSVSARYSALATRLLK